SPPWRHLHHLDRARGARAHRRGGPARRAPRRRVDCGGRARRRHRQPPGARDLHGHPGGRMSDLHISALDAGYGDFQALFGVTIDVSARQVVAVIGANGAGKSTLLLAVAGLIPARRDAITFDGEPIGDLPAHARVARGIALVPEGRRLFPSLTVEENLIIGGQLGRPGPWMLT